VVSQPGLRHVVAMQAGKMAAIYADSPGASRED
jgi:hypothetical protein